MNRQWKVMELKPVSQYGDILAALKELQEVGCELLVEGNYDAATVAVICCQQLVREAVRLTGDHNRERNLVALEALRAKVQVLDSLMMEGKQLPNISGKQVQPKDDELHPCPHCGGSGELYWTGSEPDSRDPSIPVPVPMRGPCPSCDGVGWL